MASDRCPDCGHVLHQHVAHNWPLDGQTCGECRREPQNRPARVHPCCLTSSQVIQAIEAGSPQCPNHEDPWLCKWIADLGRIVPEAGCPLHDLALNPKETTA